MPIYQLDVVPTWIAFYSLVCEISLLCEKFTVKTKYSLYFKTIAILFKKHIFLYVRPCNVYCIKLGSVFTS